MIHIIDDWYMTADRFCYTVGRLDKRKNSRTGDDEDCLKNTTFHDTVGHALRSVLQESVQDKVAKGKVKDLVTLFETMEKYNNKLIKQFDKVEGELTAKRRGPRKAL